MYAHSVFFRQLTHEKMRTIQQVLNKTKQRWFAVHDYGTELTAEKAQCDLFTDSRHERDYIQTVNNNSE